MKYIDAEKLKKAIEDKGLDCSFALKMERLNTLALIDELRESEDKRRAEELIKALQSGYYEGYQHGKEDAQKEQKPAEWSKNDTAFLNEIIDFFENKTGRLQHDLDMYAHWLKSLRPQPKGIYQQVVKGLRDMCDRYEQIGIFTDWRARAFLDNVRVKCKDAIECAPILDEPSWKPSEAQLMALHSVIDDKSDTIGNEQLKLLYNDLKKL